MDERAAATAEIVRLARQHQLTSADIAAALDDPAAVAATAAPGATGDRGVLVRVLGFLGGTFIFAGLGVFIAIQWDALGPAARVVITLGSGVGALVLASLARREPRFMRAATPFYLVAAVLEPLGLLVVFDEFGTGGDWRWAGLVVDATMAAQFGLVFAGARRAMVLFIAVSFGVAGVWSALDIIGLDGSLTAMFVGAGLVWVCVRVGRAGFDDITPLWYFIGATAFLAGLFDVVDSTIFEAVFLAAAAGLVYVSVALRSRTLLVVATLAILAYTGYFTSEHFAESIGWPLALVGFGLLMIGLSSAAVRIDRRYLRGS